MKLSVRYILLTLLLVYSAVAFSTVTPTMRVQQTVDEVLNILKNDKLDKTQKREQIRTIARARFDFRAMSQLVLAKNWREGTEEQKDRFVTLFRDLLERTYSSAMYNFNGETVRVGREQVDGNRAVVQTFVDASDGEVPVEYKLRLKDGDWYAYDVTVKGISLVINYRNSFNELVREKGMEGLLKDLENKVESLGENETPVEDTAKK